MFTHVRDDGSTGSCSAPDPSRCPFFRPEMPHGGHFDNKADAEAAGQAMLRHHHRMVGAPRGKIRGSNDDQVVALRRRAREMVKDRADTFSAIHARKANRWDENSGYDEVAEATYGITDSDHRACIEQGLHTYDAYMEKMESYRAAAHAASDPSSRMALMHQARQERDEADRIIAATEEMMGDDARLSRQNRRKAADAREKKRLTQEHFRIHPWGGHHPSYLAHASQRDDMMRVMCAYSGLSRDELVSRPDAPDDPRDVEGWRRVMSHLPRRDDVDAVVSLDLETAGAGPDPTDPTRTYIIETGWVRVSRDGERREESFLSSPSQSFLAAHGTGMEEVHHISPDMVAGKECFGGGSEGDHRLARDVCGDDKILLIAHNASFEETQLRNNLPGFAEGVDSGRIVVMDSMMYCQYFVPESATNKNGDFVASAGMEYEGAHRALEDARMTLGALEHHVESNRRRDGVGDGDSGDGVDVPL